MSKKQTNGKLPSKEPSVLRRYILGQATKSDVFAAARLTARVDKEHNRHAELDSHYPTPSQRLMHFLRTGENLEETLFAEE